MKIILFYKEYDDESLIDLDEHIHLSIFEDNKDIPVDSDGFRLGKFKVTVEWEG